MRSSPLLALPTACACALIALAGIGAARAEDAGEVTHLHVGGGRVPTLGASITADAGGETISVGRVRADSPAARAGLKTGDRIVTVNGCRVRGSAGWDAALARALPGATLVLGIRRASGTAGEDALLYVGVPSDGRVPAAPTAVAPVAAPDAPCAP